MHCNEEFEEMLIQLYHFISSIVELFPTSEMRPGSVPASSECVHRIPMINR